MEKLEIESLENKLQVQKIEPGFSLETLLLAKKFSFSALEEKFKEKKEANEKFSK